MNKSKVDVKHIKRQIQKTGSSQNNKPDYRVPEKAVIIDDSQFRPQALNSPKTNIIVAWAVFAVTLIVYLLTQARSASFWDSGEYATCISILGVPHPPGNPFYILFGRAVVTLFGGMFSHAWIAAFISGLSSAFAVMFTYLITVQLTSMLKIKDWEAMFSGIVAALLTAFSFTFWMNAIEAEVYSGLVFFVNIIIWLTLYWVQHSRDFRHQNILLLIVYLFFTGFCVHQTALQIAPAILFIVVYPLLVQGSNKSVFWYKFFGYGAALIISYLAFGAIGKSMNIDAFDQIGLLLCILALMVVELRNVFDRRLWLLGIGLVVIGVSTHIYIPIRAADRPFINLADPSTPQRFDDYFQRRQYKPEQTSMFDRRGNFFKHQMGYHFFRYFGMQWFKADTVHSSTGLPEVVVNIFGGLLIASLGLLGAVFHFLKNKHSFFYMFAIMLCVTILMVFVMNLSDEEVRDRDYFFVVAYNMWAIWMGIGALAIISIFRNKAARIAVMAVLLLMPVLNMAFQYIEHDRSREFIALDYGVNFLNSVEENAIIFTNGDNDTYPLWYTQALHDPYAKEYPIHQSRDIYPTAESQKAISTAMLYKNKELKGIRKDVTIANLSLLNTSWYIRQLRELEGVVINWNEEEINSLDDRKGSFQEYLWKDLIEYKTGDPKGEQNFSINYLQNAQNSEQSRAFYPRRGSDFSVLQIVKDNFGKRPIYFAVTCESNIGFDDYLRNEGMVARITSIKSEGREQVDFPRLLTNIDKVYQYRSIFDDRVFKDDNMKRLAMNYGSAYSRAAVEFSRKKDFDQAIQYARQARKFIDSDLRLLEFWVNYYAGTAQLNKLDKFIDKNILLHSDAVSIYNSYVLNTMAREFPQYFPRYMKKLMQTDPNQIDYAELALYYGHTFNLLPQVEVMLDSLMSEKKLGYNYADLNNRLKAMNEEDTAESP